MLRPWIACDDQELKLRNVTEERQVPLMGLKGSDMSGSKLSDELVRIRLAEGDPPPARLDLPPLRARKRVQAALQSLAPIGSRDC